MILKPPVDFFSTEQPKLPLFSQFKRFSRTNDSSQELEQDIIELHPSKKWKVSIFIFFICYDTSFLFFDHQLILFFFFFFKKKGFNLDKSIEKV